MLGEDGAAASLGEIYVVITLLGEGPPWATVEEPQTRSSSFLVLTSLLVVLAIAVAGLLCWYEFEYVPQGPQRLADAIRHNDVAMSDLLTAVNKNETDFKGELLTVVGTLPSNGSMPDDLARVCFKEKTAARAWEEIQGRTTFQSDLAPLETTQKTIESRITMGTFVETDRKAQEEAVAVLQSKENSFTELRSNLDLLRVLLEAERLPRPNRQTP